MLNFLCAAVAIAAQPEAVKPKVIDATVFKNGFSVLVYEAKVPADGVLILKEPPQASLGTVWLAAGSDTKIDSAVMTRVEEETKQVTDVEGFYDLLVLNKNKDAIVLYSFGSTTSNAAGKIISVSTQTVGVVTTSGTVFIPVSSILAVTVNDAVHTKTKVTKKDVPALRIKATPGKSVTMMALQRGMTWTPSYLLELKDGNKATLISRATMLNDIAELENQTVRFVTGFPNLRYLGIPDPFTAAMSVDDFVRIMMGSAGQAPGSPMANTAQTMRRESSGDFGAGGAFEPFDPSTGGFAAEDLFFTEMRGVTLKPGDRGYYVLNRQETTFERIFKLSLPLGDLPSARQGFAPEPPTVWSTLKVKNNGNQPWTTGVATVMMKGQTVGQDELAYTSASKDGSLTLSKALDIGADNKEEEIGREKEAIRETNPNRVWDLVTIKGTITLNNLKKEAAQMEITKPISGSVTSASHNGEIEYTPQRVQSHNKVGLITWKPQIEAGKSLEITYTYQMYVQSR